MRSRLFIRLLASQLLLVLAVLGIALAVMRARTERDFVAYLQAQQQERLETIAEAIARRRAAGEPWRQVWREIVGGRGEAFSGRGGRLPVFVATPDGQPLIPPRQPPGFADGIRVPVRVDGSIVAVVWSPPLPAHLIAARRQFAERQVRALTWALLLSLPVALLLAWYLSRRLLEPIRALRDASEAMARRQFSVRVSVLREDELGELAASFNRMAEALERAELRQRQWLADIAHELRTPLAVLGGELEALQDGVRRVTPESLASLREEVARLSRLVDDLHLVSMAEAGELPLHRQPIRVGELLEEAARRFGPSLADSGHALVERDAGGADARIDADPERLLQVLAALIDNARRHARPGPVQLIALREDGFAGFAVQDAGPGVPPQMLDRLFERLWRADAARSGRGSGLGLSICKGLIEAHGGSIRAELRDGGLRIVCLLPELRP